MNSLQASKIRIFTQDDRQLYNYYIGQKLEHEDEVESIIVNDRLGEFKVDVEFKEAGTRIFVGYKYIIDLIKE